MILIDGLDATLFKPENYSDFSLNLVRFRYIDSKLRFDFRFYSV